MFVVIVRRKSNACRGSRKPLLHYYRSVLAVPIVKVGEKRTLFKHMEIKPYRVCRRINKSLEIFGFRCFNNIMIAVPLVE
jgi:hypothetical protein